MQYNLTLVLNPEADEKVRIELLDTVKEKMLTGAKIAKEDMWGARDLAYPINKKNKGFFVHFEFETEPVNVKGMDKKLRLEEEILRYLLVKKY